MSRINADFTKELALDTHAMAWAPSPLAGVERKMLDRIGCEVARATSLVRYGPGCHFSEHVHGGGEEFLVLEGVFSDERGHYGPLCYVRNPPGSRHRPHSEQGCILFVKLQQFLPGDDRQLVLDTASLAFEKTAWPGVSLLPLHRYRQESVYLLRLAPGATVPAGGLAMAEILVLEGELGGRDRGHWLRGPRLGERDWHSEKGGLCYVKSALVMTQGPGSQP
ncbi:cupin domain-containing protein [Gallaecimonas sp. GXIMD4217]|uniref:cupin domain-containing protein n=1 Tax=Gallaecimonas sp. GXIMD4217 TaxID=3131927 RepID=UPI00311AD79E